jgi:transcriptional regulator with XRE-family HTH domain
MGRKAQGGGDNHLKAWRELRGLTQEELAEKVETSGAVISLLESGRRPLSEKWLRKFATALDTTVGFIMDHDPNDIDAAFVDAALAIPKDKREQVLVILRSFKGG